MIALELDTAAKIPEWDFTVVTQGKTYTTRLAQSEEIKAISTAASFEDACGAMNKLIIEPDANVLEWGLQRAFIFMMGYVEYLKLYADKYKTAMSMEWVGENIAKQMSS